MVIQLIGRQPHYQYTDLGMPLHPGKSKVRLIFRMWGILQQFRNKSVPGRSYGDQCCQSRDYKYVSLPTFGVRCIRRLLECIYRSFIVLFIVSRKTPFCLRSNLTWPHQKTFPSVFGRVGGLRHYDTGVCRSSSSIISVELLVSHWKQLETTGMSINHLYGHTLDVQCDFPSVSSEPLMCRFL